MKAIIDCNSFYAACERLFEPSLKNKPVVVLSNNDGCIVSRTDEAKALGIPMAGPYYQIKKILAEHEVAVFSSNYHLYGDVSWRVMETLRSLCPKIEVYSVDEAFVDLPEMSDQTLFDYGLHIKDTVELWTGIPVSVGVAPTKTLAKVANHLAKKEKKKTRCTVVLANESEIDAALKATPVREIWGIGRRYAERLIGFGIEDALKLKHVGTGWASKNLGGVVGVRLVKELNGFPCIPMRDPLVEKKMISTTRMFGRAVTTLTELKEAVATYISRAAEKLRRQKCAARLVYVFVVENNHHGNNYEYAPQTHSRFSTLSRATDSTPELIGCALELVNELFESGSRYLKAGVCLGMIVPVDEVQSSLFDPPAPMARKLMETIDNINFSMRNDVLRFASSGIGKNWKMRQEYRSPRYTTRWDEVKKVR